MAEVPVNSCVMRKTNYFSNVQVCQKHLRSVIVVNSLQISGLLMEFICICASIRQPHVFVAPLFVENALSTQTRAEYECGLVFQLLYHDYSIYFKEVNVCGN